MRVIQQDDINILKFSNLSIKGLDHFSTTILGGASSDTYCSLNLGQYCGDNSEHVAENRALLAIALNIKPENIYVPYQTHEDGVCVIDQDFVNLSIEEKESRLNGIDAIITNVKNICIGIATADCVPIIIYDPRKEVLAAVHSGWKGTVVRIVQKTIGEMTVRFGSFPTDLLVGIAPCISQKYFEVGDEVVESFKKAGFCIDTIGVRNSVSNKMHLDLTQANKELLLECGILAHNIEASGLCTYADSDQFFSARRQTIRSGRMLTGGILR